jgi:hypothetical protein
LITGKENQFEVSKLKGLCYIFFIVDIIESLKVIISMDRTKGDIINDLGIAKLLKVLIDFCNQLYAKFCADLLN